MGQSPQLKIEKDKPATFKLVKMFTVAKNGAFCWEVEVNKEKHVLFATPALNEHLEKFKPNETVTAELKTEDGKTRWHVNSVLFDQGGQAAPPAIDIEDKETRKSIFVDMERNYAECLTAARNIVREYNETTTDLPMGQTQVDLIAGRFFASFGKRFGK